MIHWFPKEPDRLCIKSLILQQHCLLMEVREVVPENSTLYSFKTGLLYIF